MNVNEYLIESIWKKNRAIFLWDKNKMNKNDKHNVTNKIQRTTVMNFVSLPSNEHLKFWFYFKTFGTCFQPL